MIHHNMSAWLNWTERLTSNQEAAGSSPAVDFLKKKYNIYMKHKNNNNKTKNKNKFKPKYGGASPNATLPVATPMPVATPIATPMAGGQDHGPIRVKPTPLSIIGKITKFITNVQSILLTIAALIAFLILLLTIYVINKLFTSLFALINYCIQGSNSIGGAFASLARKFGNRKKFKNAPPIPKTLYDLVLKSIPPLPPIF